MGWILYKSLYKVTLFLPQIADESRKSNDNYGKYCKYVNVATVATADARRSNYSQKDPVNHGAGCTSITH